MNTRGMKYLLENGLCVFLCVCVRLFEILQRPYLLFLTYLVM